MNRMPGLLAHWRLDGDVSDSAGSSRAIAKEITYGAGQDGAQRGAAVFNGRSSVIEVPDAPALRLGGQPFSISLWVKPEHPMRNVLGDLVSKFDPDSRCGLNLYLQGSSPAYNSMSDTRHVHFGIDDGSIGEWEDCGMPWPSAGLVSTLVVFDGSLYAGIADADDPKDAAHVFRYAGGTRWEDCGRLGTDPKHRSVQSMIVHNGRLYAGTGVWDWTKAGVGGTFGPSPNHVYVYEGGTEWRDLGQVGGGRRILCMASFDGDLYVGPDRAEGGICFKFDGERWIDCGAPDGDNVECLLPFQGRLYGATHKNYYRYRGGRDWTCFARRPCGITQTHSLQVVGGKLWAGTWPQGYVLRYEGGEDWTVTGRLGLPEGMFECNEVMDLTVYNGKLYAALIPKAQVYRYESDGQWALLGSLASRPDWQAEESHSWCRVTGMASYRGKLFASTGACYGCAADVDPDQTLGRVHALRAGQVVSHERDIGGDWTHLCAVRDGRTISLYVNGKLSATSVAPRGRHFDLANTRPLLIGFGAQNHFAGAMADVRLYGGALPAEQVVGLCEQPLG